MSPQASRHKSDVDADNPLFDRELEHLPPALRWREWMARVEAVIFAAPDPVSRETLLRVVGRDCNLDLIIDDIRAELADRPYELVRVAGGWQHRTRPSLAEAIRTAFRHCRGRGKPERCRGAGADDHWLFSADHARRAVEVFLPARSRAM